jgi:GxxExxY protein
MRAAIEDEDIRLVGTPLTAAVVDAAITVHKELGPGLLESAYRQAFVRELEIRGLSCELDVPIPFVYKDALIPCVFRADVLVEGKVLLELKSVEELRPVHRAQLLTYLKLAGLRIGLLINFNCPALRDGIKRLVR